MGVNPIKLDGRWDEGYALDMHILSSIPVGEDVYGNMRFDTKRTELGELIYLFKYKGKYEKLHDIVMPAPYSVSRSYQPAAEIAQAIAEYLHIHYTDEILIKTTALQSKNMGKNVKNPVGSIIALKKAKKQHTILLVDDLYETGKTLEECVKVLKEDGKLDKIFVLVMTKTR